MHRLRCVSQGTSPDHNTTMMGDAPQKIANLSSPSSKIGSDVLAEKASLMQFEGYSLPFQGFSIPNPFQSKFRTQEPSIPANKLDSHIENQPLTFKVSDLFS